jgi:hypothetical protein
VQSTSTELESIKDASEKAAKLLKEACNLLNSINNNATISAQQIATSTSIIDSELKNQVKLITILICRLQTNLIEGLSNAMENHFIETQHAVEHFTHQEIKREERTGGTPIRRLVNDSANQMFSPLPEKSDLLKQTERTPIRASIFRIRDSLLDQKLPDSPATLKSKLPSAILPQD